MRRSWHELKPAQGQTFSPDTGLHSYLTTDELRPSPPP
jgi:hypothetical protein